LVSWKGPGRIGLWLLPATG